MSKIIQALMFVAVCVGPSLATEITYKSQSRYNKLTFQSGDGDQSARDDASGFDRFDSNLSRSFQSGESAASSSATQTSGFSAMSIVADGSTAGSFGPPAGSSNASGQSYFEVEFSIDVASPYSLDLSSDNSEYGQVRFVGPSFNIDQQVGVSGGDPLSISETGTVQPGDYSLLIDINTSGFMNGTVGQYSLDFQLVPEPCVSPLLILAMGFAWLRVTRKLRA